MKIFFILFISITIYVGTQNLPLHQLKLPTGLKVRLFSRVPNARQMSLSPSGNLFIGTREKGDVSVILNGTSNPIVILTGLLMPVGVQFYQGSLFVSSINRILKYENIERDIRNPPTPIVIANFPPDRSHGWKYLKVHAGKLYVQVGAPCNTCIVRDPYSVLYEINLENNNMKKIAEGIRNSVGFDIDKEKGDLYFTDNGRDAWGDDKPPDELNKIVLDGKNRHFGFPYCYGKDLVDSQYNTRGNCVGYEPSFVDLGPHVAALGMTFLSSKTFPSIFNGKILIAEHGSWNRRVPLGYRISIVDHKETNPSYKIFIDGWLQLPNNDTIIHDVKDSRYAWGRPVDVINLPNGNILISDDKAGAIYEVHPG